MTWEGRAETHMLKCLKRCELDVWCKRGANRKAVIWQLCNLFVVVVWVLRSSAFTSCWWFYSLRPSLARLRYSWWDLILSRRSPTISAVAFGLVFTYVVMLVRTLTFWTVDVLVSVLMLVCTLLFWTSLVLGGVSMPVCILSCRTSSIPVEGFVLVWPLFFLTWGVAGGLLLVCTLSFQTSLASVAVLLPGFGLCCHCDEFQHWLSQWRRR